MARIHLADPAWQTTFPFLVEPREDEWLTGLLLHCDEANLWGSGTTLTHICRMNEKTAKSNSTLIVPSGVYCQLFRTPSGNYCCRLLIGFWAWCEGKNSRSRN